MSAIIDKWLIVVAVVGLAAVLRPKNKWIMPSAGDPWRDVFSAAESKYNLPEGLLARIALAESSYNPLAVSPAGAQGLMQIIPRWHPEAEPFDPVHSIWYSAAYMRRLHDRFGSWTEALAAYNWGQGNLSKKGLAAAPLETRNYIEKIGGDLGLV